MFVWVFFPDLYRGRSQGKSRSRPDVVPEEKYSAWYTEVILPSLAAAIPLSNQLQYFPQNRAHVKARAQANQEAFTRDESRGTRKTLLRNFIQAEYLGRLWQEI